MDLGIRNRHALVCASSQGIGLACATALAREGALVVINGRDAGRLEQAKAQIKEKTGQDVRTIVADIATDAGRQALFEECPQLDPSSPTCWRPSC